MWNSFWGHVFLFMVFTVNVRENKVILRHVTGVDEGNVTTMG